MTKTVLVTGASGFIAKHLVLQLLQAGHSVVGSVRKLERGQQVRNAVTPHLGADPGERLRFVALDLTSDEGWGAALKGVDVLMHTASPFPLAQPKDEAEVIRPALDGALRALRSAKAAGVCRVILTSSIVSIMGTPMPAGQDAYTEAQWTDTTQPSATPYAKSKTLAERAAWDFVATEAPEIALTAINPGFVLGAPLDAHFGTSIRVVQRILASKDPALPRIGFPVVDVRDVAAAHISAMETPESAGKRYAATAGFLWFYEMAQIIAAAYPGRKVVTRQAPNWLIRLLGIFDPSIKTIAPDLGKRNDVSSARAQAGLGMDFAPAPQAVKDAAAYLVDNGLA